MDQRCAGQGRWRFFGKILLCGRGVAGGWGKTPANPDARGIGGAVFLGAAGTQKSRRPDWGSGQFRRPGRNQIALCVDKRGIRPCQGILSGFRAIDQEAPPLGFAQINPGQYVIQHCFG